MKFLARLIEALESPDLPEKDKWEPETPIDVEIINRLYRRYLNPRHSPGGPIRIRHELDSGDYYEISINTEAEGGIEVTGSFSNKPGIHKRAKIIYGPRGPTLDAVEAAIEHLVTDAIKHS